MAARVSRVRVDADRVICVENLTPFYELVRRGGEDLATLCLLGNPSPACRHLLRRLVEDLPGDIPLYVWADLDYGGLNILSHVRRTVSRRFRPYRMDTATLEAFAYWGQPLTNRDRRNLQRLRDDPHLADMVDVIDALLTGEVKLEQEAIVLREV
jgi:DNA topoisomerase VI subunit A